MGKRKTPTSSKASVSGPTSPRDFVAIAREYAREAVGKKHRRRYGKWLRLAARRFLADLDRAAQPGSPFIFDAWHAEDACRFLECLPHVEGTWDTPTLVLHPAQAFVTVNLFGFRKPDGTRRFTTALYAVARKNAKTTWAAGVLLYCLVAEGEVGPQVISAATTGSQARMVFNVAKRMVEKTPDLREAFSVEAFANAIACYKYGGSFKPINAKASTQDGLNPSAVGLDELHAHKTNDLLNVLKSAVGARRNPLFLYTTTEGFETPGPWPEERKFAQQVLEKVLVADHYFAVIFALDTDDGDFDERNWEKANPLIQVNPIILTEMRKLAVEAKAKPGALAEFRIKRLNRQASVAEGFIDLPKWAECCAPVDLKAMESLPCWAAFDLASTTDLTACRFLWRDGERFYTWGRRWVPESAVAQRTERGTVPYASWVMAGLIEQTPGDVTDYAVVEAAVRADAARFKPKAIAYDAWNATDLVNRLMVDELPLVQFIQGPKSYHPAMQALERAYREGKLSHGGDPVLTWCASNLVARTDQNMNTAPDKKRAVEKIDDIVALLMCFGMALLKQEPESVYEKRGLLTL